MSDSITTAQGLRAIPSCKREDRYWWPRCFGVTLLSAVDFDLDIGDDPSAAITPDVVIVCEVYTQHGDEIGALMSEDALRSIAELIAADVNSDADDVSSDAEFDRALDAAVAHAAVRTWQQWESGDRKMPRASWELYLMQTGQHPEKKLVKRPVTHLRKRSMSA